MWVEYGVDGRGCGALTFSFNTSDNETVINSFSNRGVRLSRVRHFPGSPIFINKAVC